MRALARGLLAFLGSVVIVLTLVTGGISSYFFLRYKPLLAELRNTHLAMSKQVTASVDAGFPVNVSFDHEFQVRFRKEIHVEIPVKTTIRVPLDQTLYVPINGPFAVKLDRTFLIDEEIHVRSDLPLDTTVQARILGIDVPLPIRGSIPVDITFPLRQNMEIQEELILHVIGPLPVTVREVLEVPLDLVVRGVLPVDEDVTLPVQASLTGQVDIPQRLPCTVEFRMGPEDWGKGIRIAR